LRDASAARWYQECGEDHGLAGRLAGVPPVDLPIAGIAQAKDRFCERLLEEHGCAIGQD
jgi:hypothetical protein